MTDGTPDLCDCEDYDNQSLQMGPPNTDGLGRIYNCSACGFEGVVQ